VSLVYIVLLVLAGALLVACEWPRLQRLPARFGRQDRERPQKRAAGPAAEQWLEPEDRLGRRRRAEAKQEADEFAAQVKRDLDSLPTIDEPRRRR
jgi:uncharacterized membrane protein YcjF (UPF0283 family)